MSYHEDRFIDYLAEGDGQLGASPGDTLTRLRRNAEMKPENVKCPDCGGEMLSRTGPYGVFWGCKEFPKCKGTRDSQGRSKADREAYKKQKEQDETEVVQDSGFSFNKKSDPSWKQMK